jgi:hypothetical protein
MTTTNESALSAWFDELVAQYDDLGEAQQTAYQMLENRGALSKVTLHKYQCASHGCQIARVVKIGSTVLCATRDYKYSPGMNLEKSVPEARRKNTLNGDDWWPGHVYDVDALAEWGDVAGIGMVCRHYTGTILAKDILSAIERVIPGHPGKPTRL